MTTDLFTKAIKEQIYLRALLYGPPGSGKTYTALQMASILSTLMDTKIAMVDTEGRSSRRYADLFDFSVMDLAGDYNPQYFINAIQSAQDNGYGILVIDSVSAAWNQAGGILDMVDKASAKMSNNKWAGWASGRPAHNALVQAIINADIHLIVTARSKVEWVLEDDGKGKSKPKKVGFSPVQDSDFEYEFDFALLVGSDHKSTIVKSRFPTIDDNIEVEDTEELAGLIFNEINDGEKPQKADPRLQAIRNEVARLVGSPLSDEAIAQFAGVEKFDDFEQWKRFGTTGTAAQHVANQWAESQPKPGQSSNGNHSESAPETNEDVTSANPKAETAPQPEKPAPAKPVTNGNGGARIGGSKPEFSNAADMKHTPELKEVTLQLNTWKLLETDDKKPYIEFGGVVLLPESERTEAIKTTGEVAKINVRNLDDLQHSGFVSSDGTWDDIDGVKGRLDPEMYCVAIRTEVGRNGFSYKPETLSAKSEVAEAAASADEGVPF